jgi:hypothetical protein
MLILGAPGTLDFLAPSINYSSCRDVVQLYSVRHSGDMARIRDTAPAICRGFVIFEGRHAKSPKGERRLALVRVRDGGVCGRRACTVQLARRHPNRADLARVSTRPAGSASRPALRP